MRGFTLIEMLVVLALSAILAGVVTVSLAGTFHAARAQDVAGRIETYDRLAREYFRGFGRTGQLVFDLGRGTVTRVSSEASAGTDPTTGGALHLPSGFHLAEVTTASRTSTSGEASVACSADGQTPSYAVELADDRGSHYWMVVAGLTGRVAQARDDQEVQDIFATIGRRPVGPAAGDDAR